MEGWWWYAALERAGLQDQFEFFYGVIESGGRPVGIAPAFVMDLPLALVAPAPLDRLLPLVPPLRTQRTLFAGSPCAEEGTIGLLPGVELADVAPALQEALEVLARAKKARIIVWKDFAEPAWGALEALAARRGLFRVTSYPNSRIDLSGCRAVEDYLKLLNNDRRWKLRKKLRLSHARGGLAAAALQRPDEATLREIFALFWQTYLKGTTKFERLTLDFFRELATAEPAWFMTLRDPASGKLVAFRLSFRFGRRMINKFIGLDYSYGGDWYLYFRLWEAELEWALPLGVEEYQSGQTGYTAKLDLGLSLVPLNNYCRHLNRPLNRMLAWVARRITWATLDDALAEYVKKHGNA